ncbi:MAG: nucleotide sugar dehydrogenase [Candidatus Eisenbacteria bacterium]|nr:nucleotide sugar dehydrogenase [Candidatus Eisenbacteria bacterium]
MKLELKIKSRKATLGVIGLGYVGLPLVAEFGKAGFKVVGIDIDESKVRALKKGRSYIKDVPSKEIAELVKKGLFVPTTDFSLLRKCDTVDICVPTPLRKTKDPDVSYIVAATEQVQKYLHKGMLVVLESTTYPGTTDELILPQLEARGFKVGRDFYLAFSPERVDPGNEKFTTKNIPKVVGGVTPNCTRIAQLLYRQTLSKVVGVSSTRVAEMVKLLENTFRSVNIGMVNEMALMCDRMGMDVWEVIEAASTKPFGFMPFYPGPGLGGHCIPIDPFYLSWKARETGFEARFIELAGQVNGQMPHHAVDKVALALNHIRRSLKGSRVLVVGVAYKNDIDDVRESPALDILELLHRRGAKVDYHDPFVPVLWMPGGKMRSVRISAAALRKYHCAVVVTAHRGVDYPMILRNAATVVDTRNALKGRKAANLFRI